MTRTLLFSVMMLFAISATAGPGNIEESTIGVPPYQALYEKQGKSQALPKVLVYSPIGECIGVTTTDETPPAQLLDFIVARLKANKRQCKAVLAQEFGVTSVGAKSGTGRPTVQLIAMQEAFCTGCVAYRRILTGSSRPAGVALIIVNVDFSTAHNPPRKRTKDCPTCGKTP